MSTEIKAEDLYCRFWIKSNRGTDDFDFRLVRVYSEGDAEPDIRCALESWCSDFGAWSHGDNVVRYGYEIVGRNVKLKPEVRELVLTAEALKNRIGYPVVIV